MRAEGPTRGKPVPKGSKVYCSRCGSRVYETTREITSGDRRLSTDFKGYGSIRSPAKGAKAECPICLEILFTFNNRMLYEPPG